MILSIIVALAQNYAIGKNNDLLCHIPGDLKRFKTLTSGHTVIMGRHTWLSLPKAPLSNRKNIVLSSDKHFKAEGCLHAKSFEEALNMAQGDDEVFIIGGGNLYKQALPIADKLYLTWIKHNFTDADTYFPTINFDDWKETFRENYTPEGENPYSFSFINYERIK